MIPVKNRNILDSMNVKLSMINDISNEKDVVGYHVYTVENGSIYTRNFAPKVGIDEECATGTSNGALCSLLYNRKIVSAESKVIQGEAMNEKSFIYVRINDKNDTLDVRVGGKASIVKNLII
jgi:PhzF family phenazine biosynthesis protein